MRRIRAFILVSITWLALGCTIPQEYRVQGAISGREKELEQEIEKLLAKADEADALEDNLYGKGKKADELPEELAFREKRLTKKPRLPWNRG